MANENKLTTMGQMRDLAQRQDARDEVQDEQIRRLDEENDGVLKYTEQTLTEEEKSQARTNIGASEAGHTHEAITAEQIDAIIGSIEYAEGVSF